MTAIITLATRAFVIQTSDRLVSKAGKSFDEASNKNVLFLARDAIMAVGYSGAAYLDGIPTDSWIAQAMSGEELAQAQSPEPFATTRGKTLRWPNYGQAIGMLLRGAEEAFHRLSVSERSNGLSFAVGGWRWSGSQLKRAHPVVSQFNIATKTQETGSKWWYLDGPLGQIQLGLSILPDGMEFVRYSLLDHLSMFDCSARGYGQPLVSAVRRAARQHPGVVGEDVIQITIPHVRHQRADVVYHPRTPKDEVARLVNMPVSFRPGFSPWIVSRRSIVPPSAIVGHMASPLGTLTVHTWGPAQPPAGEGPIIHAGFFPTRRKAKPAL